VTLRLGFPSRRDVEAGEHRVLDSVSQSADVVERAKLFRGPGRSGALRLGPQQGVRVSGAVRSTGRIQELPEIGPLAYDLRGSGRVT
jgi:hypothetical protein